jgi:hypothetical protein
MAGSLVWNPLEAGPAVRAKADAIAADLIRSLHRARDHVLDPDRHRLTGGNAALERRLAANLARLEPRLRRRGGAGRPAVILPARPVKFRDPTSKQRDEIMAGLEQVLAGDFSVFGATGPTVEASLSISRLECVQDTAEPGADEIAIGAVATTTRVLADGTLSVDSRIIDPIDMGKFRKDDVVDFNPALQIAAFQAATPAALTVHMVMIEDDLLGGIKPVLKDLVDGLENRLDKKQIVALFATAAELVAIVPIGMAIASGGLLTQIIAFIVISAVVMVAAAIVATLLLALVQIFRDEIFPTQTTSLSVGATGAVDAGTTAPFDRRFSRSIAVYDGTFAWQA